jgi:TonB family protein
VGSRKALAVKRPFSTRTGNEDPTPQRKLFAVSVALHATALYFLLTLPPGVPNATTRSGTGRSTTGNFVEVAILKAAKSDKTNLPSVKSSSAASEKRERFKTTAPHPEPKPQSAGGPTDQSASTTDIDQNTDAASALTSGDAAAAASNFQQQLLNYIEAYQQYPERMRQRGIEGSAQVLFTMDRSGKVLGIQLLQSSGSATLDQEAVETVLRAQPLLTIPDGLPDPLNITISIGFFLSRTPAHAPS